MAQPIHRRAVPPDSPPPLGADAQPAMVSRLRQSRLFRGYQRAFEATTGLPLVLRAAGSFRTPLEGSKRVNRFCALMTRTNQTCAACLQLQQRVEVEARQAPKTLQCYAGLSESAVPVRVGTTVLGYLQTGQVFLRTPSKKDFNDLAGVIPRRVAGAGSGELESAYFQTRVVSRSVYQSIIRLLVIFSDHLATVSNQMLIAETTAEAPMITKGRAFIAEHQTEALRMRDVARTLNMSAHYFCKMFKGGTGLTFTDYLSRARVESVKRMLLNPHLRIGEAGFAAGFQSLSQFNRVFHRVAGEAPSSYRERLHGSNGQSAPLAVAVHAA